MLQVSDVGVSSRWYQTVIGLRSGHGGDEFDMLFDGDDFVLQLHRLDAHEHGLLQPDPDAYVGGGVSLWFEAADRDAFDSLIDPDGYIVIVNTPFDPTA